MKRYMILVAVMALSGFALTYQPTRGQQPGTRRDTTSSSRTSATTELPKGKLLVEKLPEGLEGVVFEKGVMKTKPGYKFVKKDNQVMVSKIGGGGGRGLTGTWNCSCTSGGSGCEISADENAVLCRKTGSCGESCLMNITIKGVKSQLLQY